MRRSASSGSSSLTRSCGVRPTSSSRRGAASRCKKDVITARAGLVRHSRRAQRPRLRSEVDDHPAARTGGAHRRHPRAAADHRARRAIRAAPARGLISRVGGSSQLHEFDPGRRPQLSGPLTGGQASLALLEAARPWQRSRAERVSGDKRNHGPGRVARLRANQHHHQCGSTAKVDVVVAIAPIHALRYASGPMTRPSRRSSSLVRPRLPSHAWTRHNACRRRCALDTGRRRDSRQATDAHWTTRCRAPAEYRDRRCASTASGSSAAGIRSSDVTTLDG